MYKDINMRIFIVDDQRLIIEAWTNLLSEIEDFEIVGFALESKDALLGIKSYRPDIVLLDINLKEASGIELCERIINEVPKTKVIGLSLNNKIAIVKKIISKGAKGYLTKNVETDELVKAINKVHNGEMYICEEIQSKLMQEILFSSESRGPSKELTSKEIEVLEQIAIGLTSKEIADELFVSARTIETHRHNILKKLGLPNTARLISWAVQNGYLNN
jgi:DNA-binding NarL/FixJ family response regulator